MVWVGGSSKITTPGWHLDVGLDQLEDPAPSGDERVAVDRRALDVLVAAERVEVVRLVVVERRLLAEPAKRRVRIGVDADVVRVVVHVAQVRGGQSRLPWLNSCQHGDTNPWGAQGAASTHETCYASRVSTTTATAEVVPDRWYQLTPEEVATRLDVDPSAGLSALEVGRRQQQYGSNLLAAKETESALQAFLRQYQDLMQIILIGAAIVNQVVTGESGTTIVLVGLTIFNAVLGLRQEAKAEASLAALQKMLKDIARVRRDGVAVEIDAAELVPGDIVLFEAGNRVPADGRLLVAATLEIEEAALTGESAPVLKELAPIPGDDVGLGDRICLAFMNTSVTRGRGEMVVTGTGMNTEIGNIATLLNQTEADKTPLQKQLDGLDPRDRGDRGDRVRGDAPLGDTG